MPSPRRLAIALLFVLTSAARTLAADAPSPEKHLGFRPGADFHLADWPAVVDYFEKVDAASDRVAVRRLGETTEGRPYIVAAVSAPETLRDARKYQDLQHRLSDPRRDPASSPGLDPVAASKPVVVITCSIHSTETASTLMAMELLHELATADDAATREILDSTILLLVPSANPDGVAKVAQWYERSKGHPWEGAGMPELYHKYAGHDTNRDWFMLNLQETRLLTRLLYKEWFPTILYDVHQMGSRGARLFVPPFFDPINPNLDARVNQSIFAIGAHMAADLAAAGKRGVLTNAMYDNWWNGGNRTTPQRHNIVAVLTEAASVRMASPIFLEKNDLRGGSRGFRDHALAVNFVDPWPGGWWRLRDIVDYELICARSILTLAGRYRTQFQTNLRAMARQSIQKGEDEPPYAWVVPPDQHDSGSARTMLRILADSGIEARSAKSAFQADGVSYPAGTWIFPAAQPYRSHLKDMMERQVYPSRFTASGAPEAPYDVAGWTLPLQMGVRTVTISSKFTVETAGRIEPARGGIDRPQEGTPRFYSIDHRGNDDFLVLNALADRGVELKVDQSRGRIVFKADDATERALDMVLSTASTRIKGHVSPPHLEKPATLHRARIGVYQPWMPSMDEGWTRLVLENFRFPYVTIHNAEIRAGKLIDRIDSLVIPSIGTRTLTDGYGPDQTEPAYVGGLGDEGAAALRAFVKDGGTLVCLEDSCEYAIAQLDLRVTNALKGLRSAQFYAPGSIVRVERASAADPSSLTFGCPDKFSAYFDQSLAFSLATGSGDSVRFTLSDGTTDHVRMALRYASKDPLESGWLLGPEKIEGKAALVDYERGKGRVVLFGFPAQHRGQPHGTFRLLFNALFRVADDHGK